MGTWGWGSNSFNTTLGVGDALSTHATPAVMAGGRDYLRALGDAIAIGTDSAGYYFGINTNGTFWNGVTGGTQNVPQLISAITAPIVKIASAGVDDVFALTSAGDLWACGSNSSGEMGQGNTTAQRSGLLVHTGVSDIACDTHGCLILTTTGRLLVAGAPGQGSFGLGNNTPVLSWTDATPAIGVRTIAALAASATHTLLLLSDGSVWGAGCDSYGQLGPNSFAGGPAITSHMSWFDLSLGFSDVTAVAVSRGSDSTHGNTGTTDAQSFVLRSDGSVWAFGLNEPHGSLGVGNLTTPAFSATPVAVSMPTGITAASLMQNQNGICMGFVGSDGNIYMWGQNGFSTLGDGTATDNPTPSNGTGLSGCCWLSGYSLSAWAGTVCTPVTAATGRRSWAAVIGD